MKNSIKKDIDFLGLNYKKEILKIVLINVGFIIFFIAIFALFKQKSFILLGIASLILLDFFLLTSYSSKKKLMLKERDEEFIYIIGCFETFLNNGCNVYQAFNKCIDYSSDWMKENIITLLNGIDSDKSIAPFIAFAENFTTYSIKNMMIAIYQMVDDGTSESQFERFASLQNETNKNYQEAIKEERNKGMAIYQGIPLVGAAFIIIVLSISLVSIVGEILYVF